MRGIIIFWKLLFYFQKGVKQVDMPLHVLFKPSPQQVMMGAVINLLIESYKDEGKLLHVCKSSPYEEFNSHRIGLVNTDMAAMKFYKLLSHR